METSWLSLAPWNPKSLFSWPGKRVHGFFNTFSWDVHEKEIRSGGSTVQETDKVPWDNLYILCAVYEFDMQMPVRQSDASQTVRCQSVCLNCKEEHPAWSLGVFLLSVFQSDSVLSIRTAWWQLVRRQRSSSGVQDVLPVCPVFELE